MEIRKRHITGIIAALIILIINTIFLRGEKIFYFITGIAVVVASLPFIFTVILESKKEKENNEMFLEFSRNLVESVKAGTPVSRSIINLKGKYYGSLTPHVQKLANQISIGIPVKEALEVFAKDVNSKAVSRAVNLISQAEKAGGEIENILESVAESVSETEKLKKERKAAVYSLVVQGYIIFFVFIVIMLIMQFKILPMTSEVAKIGEVLKMSAYGGGISGEELTRPLLYLLLVQGFFSGLVIGKLTEGKIKAGIKHSFLLVALSLLIYTGARAFF
jgi:flagellar protein FlaJ